MSAEDWTDQRVELLKKLWQDGLSCTQIAKQLNCGFSRNAVIGKVSRLRLPMRGRGGGDHQRRSIRRAKGAEQTIRLPTTAPPKAPGMPVKPLPLVGLATVETIGRHACKWPIGDPLSDGFTFCGRPAHASYCPEHAQVAYRPTEPKNKPENLARVLRRYM